MERFKKIQYIRAASERADGCRWYILSPDYALRGWKLLPYAVQMRNGSRTEFFKKQEFDLLKSCDGKTAIQWNNLTEDQRRWYEHWEKNHLIFRVREGAGLLPQQEYVFYPARFKEMVNWSITGKCNFRCRHCFMSAPHAAQGEPSWNQLMNMLEAFHRCGIKAVSLTGGEPLIRTDFWSLVDEILARDMVIPIIYSNGMLVTDDFFDKLRERKIRPGLQFSFDGVGYHDWMRGVQGAEEAVKNAFLRCKERGIFTSASMCLFKENKDSIRETVNLLAELGCYGLKIANASPQGEWKDQKEHYLTQAEVYEAFLEYIPLFFEDGCPMSISLEGFFNYDKKLNQFGAFQEKDIPEKDFGKKLMCGHVRREMYVSPQGNVLPCMSMVGGPIEEQFPNMLETPLEEILDKKSLYMDITNLRVSDYMEHNPECKICEYRENCCGGCRALAVCDGGTDYLAKDKIVCEYFKGGWKEKKDALLKSLGY